MLNAALRRQVIAYVFPQERLLRPTDVDAARLTRINYAFANVKKGRLVAGFPNDRDNLRVLVGLKQRYPELKILISVGGWSWSGGFSDLALTEERRQVFIESALAFIKDNSLDGIDVDWEYPGMTGNGNKHRPEDKANYTALLKGLRERLDSEGRVLGRRLLLSIAAGASEEFVANTELRQVQHYVDTINLMSYDYYVPSVDHTTGHHAPLFPNPADPKHVSASGSVALFEQAGVPAAKLILGVPFYGHAWSHVTAANNGLFQHGRKSNLEPDYKTIVKLEENGGYTRHWDDIAKAPYLFNAQAEMFITYEDPRSIRRKCHYILEKHLGGIMFWEYSNDLNEQLLRAIQFGPVSHPAPGKRY